MRIRAQLRTVLEVASLQLIRLLLRLLPLRLVPLPGRLLGWFLFSVLRLERRQTLATLELAFGGEYAPAERERLAGQCYRHFGGVITEFLSLPRLSPRWMGAFITLVNPTLLDEERQAGRGVILVSGHLGNWELMAAAIAARGLPISLYVGQQHNRTADAIINGIRRRMGEGTIAKHSAMRGLKANEIVGLLPDQHYSRNRHFIRFFGRPSSSPPGPATLALHTGARLVFGESVRVGAFRYVARFSRIAVPPPSGNEELDLLRVSQAIADAVEKGVRRHPDQYFWMHRRWRQLPGEETLTETNRAFLADPGAPPPEREPSRASRGTA
jgi:KDO2-lipid IV(A) lauroyltransferase